jgi:hypothetical protein
MPTPDDKKRQRSTKAQLEKYGKNGRRIWHEYAVVKDRLQYLCDIFFASNWHEMALAVGVCRRQLYRVLYGHSRLTVRMAGQIVIRLGIRAEWLLCGSGPLLPSPDHAEYFQYLPHIHSCYYTPNLNEQVSGALFLPVVPPDADTEAHFNTANFSAAARSIFSARSQRKPVLFFLAAAGFTVSTPPLWQQFFSRRYANMLMTTLSAACLDLACSAQTPPQDINTLALTAAATGASYGETIGRLGFQSDDARSRSVMGSVFAAGTPVLVSAEIGEISNHTNPAVRPPELGAAVGAAAYVDLLAFTRSVPNFFGNPGGVIVACGNAERIASTFLARLLSLNIPRDETAHFTFVVFDQPPAGTTALDTAIHNSGGRVIYLSQPTVASITQLLHSCDDAYAGKLLPT